jgi:hypothetical protein
VTTRFEFGLMTRMRERDMMHLRMTNGVIVSPALQRRQGRSRH